VHGVDPLFFYTPLPREEILQFSDRRRNRRKRLALVSALDRFALLVVGEFERSAHFLSACDSPRLGLRRCARGSGHARTHASAPRTVRINRPCDVVVSAHVSPMDLKPAFLAVIAASVFNRSRVDRASRSSRVTVRTSPASSWSSNRRSCARSVFAPLALSAPKTKTHAALGRGELAAAGRRAGLIQHRCPLRRRLRQVNCVYLIVAAMMPHGARPR
jgi:hypothetical protein